MVILLLSLLFLTLLLFCEKKIEEQYNLTEDKVNSNKDFDMTLKMNEFQKITFPQMH